MRAGTADSRPMRGQPWQAWVGVLVLGLGVAVAGPADGAPPAAARSPPVARSWRRRSAWRRRWCGSTRRASTTMRSWEKARGPDHSLVALSLDNLAVVYLGQGRLPQAVASAVLATGSEDQKRLYMNKLVSATYLDLSQHVRYAPADRDAARLGLTVVLRRKGRVLDAMTDGFAALRRSLVAGDQALLDRAGNPLATEGCSTATETHFRSPQSISGSPQSISGSPWSISGSP